ncbi:MAG TPA: hypothetical protein VM100_12230, partial [Longimicrobiales bacterium]|nr:hypothetical protein [Longimicrobiales bacterium]
GTVPHALIASFGGDTLSAVQAFVRNIPDATRLIPLVDFNNDSVATALELARALGDRLWGVRLDTSESMVDKSLAGDTSREKLTGVNARLVHNVRNALDAEGFKDVKIVVSGGFNVEKIQSFMSENVPVDAFGVGSSLFKESFDFKADIVLLEGEPAAKAGRQHKPNDRFERVV